MKINKIFVCNWPQIIVKIHKFSFIINLYIYKFCGWKLSFNIRLDKLFKLLIIYFNYLMYFIN